MGNDPFDRHYQKGADTAFGASLRHRRVLTPLRRLAKHVLVRWDLLRHRWDFDLARWLPVLQGAYAGHIVVPSRAVATSRAEAQDFARHGLVRRGDDVLDIGAGNGRQAIGLLEMDVGTYTGLEIIKDSVEYANAVFSRFGNVRFDFFDVTNDMYNPRGRIQPEQAALPYSENSFDFVVAGSLYTHLERLIVAERYVAESARVLRPDGAAFMSWFRSPPNTVNASAVRTVFPEGDICRIVEEHFAIVEEAGGNTTDWHDQWRLYLRKRPARRGRT
jgi:SAM-dependent methyltransferase